jgi:hypothetical protein
MSAVGRSRPVTPVTCDRPLPGAKQTVSAYRLSLSDRQESAKSGPICFQYV